MIPHVGAKVKKIQLEQIDISDTFFKISKGQIDENLKKSIQQIGVIEPPALIEHDGKYTIFYGHNIIKILIGLNFDTTEAVVMNEAIPDLFAQHAFLKNYRGELGPLGKIKFLKILANRFNYKFDLVKDAAKILNVPLEFFGFKKNEELIDRIPERLKEYIDSKDINFKVIKSLLLLPAEGFRIIEQWIDLIHIKTNIFKKIIEYMADIYKRDKTFDKISGITFNNLKENKAIEDNLFREIFEARYPEYSSAKKKADEISRKMLRRGIKLDIPPYFEGDEINICFALSKRENIDSIKNKLNSIDKKDIELILGLL